MTLILPVRTSASAAGIPALMRRKLLDTVFGADDEQVAEAQEQAGLEDSDHRLKAGIELFGVGDFGKLAVDDRITAVGQVGRTARERADAGLAPSL